MCGAENPEQSQERKRTRVDDESKEGSSSLEDKSERMRNYVPFLLTKVRNISGRFNDSKIAVGLRGGLYNYTDDSIDDVGGDVDDSSIK